MKKNAWVGIAAAACLVLAVPAISQDKPAKKIENVFSGIVQKVDKTAKTMAVKTADGTVHIVKWTGEKADKAGKAAESGVEQGAHVVVHTVGEGASMTAEKVSLAGKKAVHESKIVVTDVRDGGKTVVGKTADGAEVVYHVSEHAAVEGGKTVTDGVKKGAHYTVYYTEEAGHKMAHGFSTLIHRK